MAFYQMTGDLLLTLRECSRVSNSMVVAEMNTSAVVTSHQHVELSHPKAESSQWFYLSQVNGYMNCIFVDKYISFLQAFQHTYSKLMLFKSKFTFATCK